LIRHLQELVAERFGVDLELEVRLVGEFGDKGEVERATL
jgi:UDP-N-acetylenolpyruvoylglucosamine reductase